jgi:2-keto-4-pentenoate hydratase
MAGVRTIVSVDPRIVAALGAQLRARYPGARRVGWKIALGIAEIEELIGPAPVIGNLTSATQLEDGATYRGGGPLHADAEVVIEAGTGGLGVGLELVDLTRPPGGAEAIVAANVLHRAFVLGASRPGAVPGEGALIVNGEVRARAPAVVDVDGTLRAVARWLAAVGEELRPGDRVFAGSVVQVPVAPGDRVAAAISGLGRVEVAVADERGVSCS